jgi:hypothetical protein
MTWSQLRQVAGVLLGKAKIDSVYGQKMSPIVNCATVSAV